MTGRATGDGTGRLLAGRLLPITRHLVFVEGEPVELAALFAQLRGAARAELGGGATHAPVPAMPLEQTLRVLDPLSGPQATRFLLVPTRGRSPWGRPWTLFVGNAHDGLDPGNPVAVYASRGHRCLQVTVQPHTYRRATDAGYYGWLQLSLAWQREAAGLEGRTLRLQHSGYRWQWLEAGPVQDFERPDLYRSERAFDRLTIPLIGEYAAALGVRYADEDFYDPAAGSVLVRHTGPGYPGAWQIALEEAQRRREGGLSPRPADGPADAGHPERVRVRPGRVAGLFRLRRR